MTDNKFEIVPEDTQELPAELQAELRTQRTSNLERNLTKLFSDGKQRTINDALIDYWHAHKEVVKRGTMTQTLATMAKAGVGVRRVGKGVYVGPHQSPAAMVASVWPAGVPHPADKADES